MKLFCYNLLAWICRILKTNYMYLWQFVWSNFKEEVYWNKVHLQLYFSYSETLKAKDTRLNHFTYVSFTELICLSYLHFHIIKVLSSHIFLVFIISYLNMLTRSSYWIFNPMRYTGNSLFNVDCRTDTK